MSVSQSQPVAKPKSAGTSNLGDNRARITATLDKNGVWTVQLENAAESPLITPDINRAIRSLQIKWGEFRRTRSMNAAAQRELAALNNPAREELAHAG